MIHAALMSLIRSFSRGRGLAAIGAMLFAMLVIGSNCLAQSATIPATAPSTASATAPATAPSTVPAVEAAKPWFDPDKRWLLAMVAVLCFSVLLFIQLARAGKPMWVRKIAALDAIDEAVGRATEMGRPSLFVPGVQDMDDMGTIAGVSILSRIAKTTAEYGSDLEVPTSKGLVMTACRETMQASFYEAGRPDAYNPDKISYITDDQFGFVAYLVGTMVRRRPAACFYMGTFFAESLLLAETGNSIGAIQIAGTRETSQLPFFIAACDYTLIGEEFFAASAYLSKEPDQLGSLKGQDLGKLILGGIIVVGCVFATASSLWSTDRGSFLRRATDYIRFSILK